MSKEKFSDTTQKNSIGLADFIEQVKTELLTPHSGVAPLFSIDQVELELQVTVHKEGNAGIQIQIIQAGGKLSNDDVHRVKLTLTPLLSKEERLRIYDENHPGQEKAMESIIAESTFKGALPDAKDY